MAAKEIFSELIRACQNLARSVDPKYVDTDLHDIPVGEFNYFQGAVNYIKESLSLTRIRHYSDDIGYLQSALRDFTDRLRYVSSDDRIDRLISRVRFRGIPRHSRSGDTILHPALFEGGVTVKDALYLLGETVQAIPLEALVADESVRAPPTLRDLGRVLPSEQAPAPAQFAIDMGRIRLVRQPAQENAEDSQNVLSASEQLIESGQKIIEELSRSNCDRRLIEGFEELQARIASKEDVIRTGITNITCSHLFEQFRNELPDALYGMMQGHSVAVSMYVGQFPEWRRFADQATGVNIEREHVPHIAAAARQISEKLNQQPTLADPEVPRLLTFLSELVSDPKKAGQRAVFAALRTLENLLLAAYSYARDLFTKTADKTVDKLSTAAARIIVVAVTGAILLAPVVASLPEVAWVQKATEIVLQELRKGGIDIP